MPKDLKNHFKVAPSPALAGRLVFTATVYGHDRIFVLDLEKLTLEPLIDGPGKNSYPNWSPDGSEIVFTSDRDGNKEIYISDWLGEKQTRLTDYPGIDDNPSWSPDGRRIVFFRDTGKSSNIVVADKSGGAVEQVTNFSGHNVTPRWSPDGSKIAFSTDRFWPGWNVCIWNVIRKVEICPLRNGTFCRPSWSRAGDTLLFSAGMHKDIDIGSLAFDGSSWRQISQLKGREYDAIWSPDDLYVVFAAENEKPENFNLMLYSVKTRTMQPLINSPFSIRYPSWTSATSMSLEAKRARGTE